MPWKRKKNGSVRSQQAILDANKSLERVQARDPEVHAVSRALKTIRERNHFAEQLRTIMEGG
jgi:hypothetical protein